jgi:3-hydroxyisobutyrate dehydrogenase-like beta-hydroxyacid dehydrogenase
MRIETVAIIAPGDMGHGVARVLKAGGLRVITCLAGRSARTRALAETAGVEDVGDDRALVGAADVLLSIVVPARAEDLARRLAPALQTAAKGLPYVDCNAIAPQTARRIGEIVAAAGGRFVDAGIIGPPPRPGATATRFYASGAAAEDFAALGACGLDVRIVSERPGDASAVKMCYAALTKGTTAIMTELLVAAERLGVSDTLRAELEQSQSAMVERMGQGVPAMVPKAHRWVGEMAEIARTFAGVGLTPLTFEGAAALYAFIAGTAPGQTSPEDWRAAGHPLDQVIASLAAADDAPQTQP